MIIKTITCHDVYNVGASLQAYAFVTYLHNLGHDAQIIDYKPKYLCNQYRLWGVSNSKFDKPFIRTLYSIAKLPERISARCSKRKAEYDHFTADFLPITKRKYTTNDELKRNPPKADVYFAGSDQIWNTMFNNGKDPAFYLDFAPADSVKASYAASFATEDVVDSWKPQVKKWISALDYVSVRESSAVTITRNLGIKNVVQVLDPVFLLESEQWEVVEKSIGDFEPYILLYDFDRNPEIVAFAQKFALQNGWKLYSVLSCPGCDRCFEQDGPQTFLYLIHHAEYVVSNSFHATAFSLIYKKEFLVTCRQEGINSRMRDLTSLVGAPSRFISDWGDYGSLEKIDWNQINTNLQNIKNQSERYINCVIKGENNDPKSDGDYTNL